MEFIKEFANLLFPPKNEYCQCKRTNKDYCKKIEALLQMTKTNKNFNPEKSKEIYFNLLEVKGETLFINSKNITQIKKDLKRTYPGYRMFEQFSTQKKLFNVLTAFSNYDKEISYFQGMNFIVGFLLYHCEEYVAFWLFVAILEDYDYRSIFREGNDYHPNVIYNIIGFLGLKEHSEKVKEILKTNYESLYTSFNQLEVNYQVLLVEWLYSLFSSLIPLEAQMNFYIGFFTEGWKFFYKMCISSFLDIKGTFINAEDVYIELKKGKNEELPLDIQIKTWEKLINRAYQIKLKDE